MPLPDTIKLSLEKTSHLTKERVLLFQSSKIEFQDESFNQKR